MQLLNGSQAPTGRGVLPAAAPRHHEIVLLGAHGGAGVSTLRVLLDPAWDMGAISPIHLKTRYSQLNTHGRPLVMVARNTVPAARWATHAVRAVAGGGGQVALLVVVADGAGPEPREATARFRLLETHLMRGMVRVPFIRALRYVDEPSEVEVPKAAGRALQEIRERIDGPTPKEFR